LVLDPFIGAGTTACVALEHGRLAWGIDLSAEYLTKLTIPRLERLSRYRHAETKHYRELNRKLNAKLKGK
jgi:DNA modification methylase